LGNKFFQEQLNQNIGWNWCCCQRSWYKGYYLCY